MLSSDISVTWQRLAYRSLLCSWSLRLRVPSHRHPRWMALISRIWFTQHPWCTRGWEPVPVIIVDWFVGITWATWWPLTWRSRMRRVGWWWGTWVEYIWWSIYCRSRGRCLIREATCAVFVKLTWVVLIPGWKNRNGTIWVQCSNSDMWC